MNAPESPRHRGIAGRIAAAFIGSRLTPLVIIASILLGVGAVLLLPREEEPQIVVPMVDVFVQMPGASATEVENRVTRPMEKLLWEIPGVEYVYSTTSPGQSMAIVRFKVGEDEEKSIVRLNQKMSANFDLIPPGATPPLVKPRSIDDVPILAVTLSSARHDPFSLRRIAQQLHDQVKSVPDVSEVKIIGGQRRQVRVLLDPARMAARGVAPAALVGMLRQANRQLPSGSIVAGNREFLVETGGFLRTAEDVGQVVAGVAGGRPVYLRDVAQILDGPEEPADYVLFGPGPAARANDPAAHPAVTLSVAKRKGTNAIEVADKVLAKIEALKGTLVPGDVTLTVTRNYGETAAEKSNELLLHMLIAVVSVSILIWITLGFREAGIVATAIPVTLALTLTVFYLTGYTLNRVTLFALIFSIGILVDDAIVVVENIVRHYRLPENRGRSVTDIAVEAVDEVGNPTILATFAVIAAILPMAFVRGLMGPYMRPIPVGATAAMLFSLLVAFVVTPWTGVRLLRKEVGGQDHAAEGWTTRLYREAMGRLLHRPAWRYGFLAMVVVLLLGSASLVAFRCGAGEDAPVRQQERVPGGGRHAGRVDPRADRGRDPGDRRRRRRRAGSVELPDVRRDLLPVQLQRAGAPLLPAAGGERRRPPGEPCSEGGAEGPEPRHREEGPAGDPGGGRAIRREREGVGGPPGAAGPPDAGGRGVRPRLSRADRGGPQGQGDPVEDRGGGRRRLVRRGRPAAVPLRGRSGQGGVERRFHGTGGRNAASRRGRDERRDCSTGPGRRKTCRSSCASRGRSGRSWTA